MGNLMFNKNNYYHVESLVVRSDLYNFRLQIYPTDLKTRIIRNKVIKEPELIISFLMVNVSPQPGWSAQ